MRCMRLLLVSLCLLCVSLGSQAAPQVTVGLIVDGAQTEGPNFTQVFLDELITLTEGEFDLRFKQFSTEWSALGARKALQGAYWDPDVDMVLVLGVASTQLIIGEAEFAKPTFLPLLLNAGFVTQSEDTGSGIENLNYLTDSVPFADDMATFRRLVPFTQATIVGDELMSRALDIAIGGPSAFVTADMELGLSVLPHTGPGQPLEALIPPPGHVVLLGALQRMPDAQFREYMALLQSHRIPAFSLWTSEDVRKGALAADVLGVDIIRIARRTALNIQAVLLGDKTASQPTVMVGKRELVINMQTAHKIGVYPSFDVLGEATLLYDEPVETGPELTLEKVGLLALSSNLDITAAQLDVQIGEQDVSSTRANLLPQVEIIASSAIRDDNELVRGAGSPERSTDGALVLDQLVYSETARSGYVRQRYQLDALRSALTTAELDQVSSALTAFIQTLQAKDRLDIQRENLTLSKANLALAQDRARIGADNLASVYRWESSVATARTEVQLAHAQLDQAYEGLNRLLNRPVRERPQLVAPAPDDPFSMSETEFNTLVGNPLDYVWFGEFMVELGLESSPEIAQLQAQQASAERLVTEKSRAFWVPDVSLQAQLQENQNRSGLGSGEPLEGLDDWSVTLNARLPLFSSGARRAELNRAKLSERKLGVQLEALRDSIEQTVWSELHATRSSYANIDLFNTSAIAARKNLKLVTDGYREGTLPIIDLIDAQNQLVQAQLSAKNAIHDFLLTAIRLQRATGQFDFLLPPAEQQQFNERFRAYFSERAAHTSGSNP